MNQNSKKQAKIKYHPSIQLKSALAKKIKIIAFFIGQFLIYICNGSFYKGNAKPLPWPLPGDAYAIDPITGNPSDEDCSEYGWFTYYFTDVVAKSFQNLYKNVDGLLDEWANFWGMTARYFKSYSSVIGYELINEPFCGDVFT